MKNCNLIVPISSFCLGCIRYKGAKIQLLDLPGIIEGAKDGKGRGRQVIAVARTASLIFIGMFLLNIHRLRWTLNRSIIQTDLPYTFYYVIAVLDVLKPLQHKRALEKELEGFGIRLNKEPPQIGFRRKEKGGINLQTLCTQSELDLELVIIVSNNTGITHTLPRKFFFGYIHIQVF